MELHDISQPAKIMYDAKKIFTLIEGEKIQLRHSENGEVITVFNKTVPSGKKWYIRLLVDVLVENM